MPLPLVLLLTAAAVAAASGVLALPFRAEPRRGDAVAAAALTLAGVLGALALGLAGATTTSFARPWPLPTGAFAVALDPLSAAFLAPIFLIPILSAWYGIGGWPTARHPRSGRRIRIALGILVASMVLLVLARDAVLFLFAFEGMALAAFFSIAADDDHEEARRASWWYLLASHCGLFLLFAAFQVLHLQRGDWSLDPGAASGLNRSGQILVFVLVLAGFGLKSGLMPLHIWLPGAHAAAPSHVSAVLSGVVIKMGVYGMARIAVVLPAPQRLEGVLLLLFGAVSGIAGVVCAIGQHDIKRLLAFHSIENIGIIYLGLGLALLGRWAERPELAALGYAAAVMHVWNHGLFKALLFMAAGSVVHAVGSRDLDRMGGLQQRMPWSAACFLIGAIAICGLPPLNGFVSELYLYLGALHGLRGAAGAAALIAPVLAMIGALACACFLKVYGAVFLGRPRAVSIAAHESPWSVRVPMLVLALACVALGIAPTVVAPALAAAARAGGIIATRSDIATPNAAVLGVVGAAILGALALFLALRAAAARAPRQPTWDCGHAAGAPRAQYTASSLGQALVRLFGFLLRPQREADLPARILPAPSRFATHVPDSSLSALITRSRRAADRLRALRSRGAGRLQGYLLLIAVTVLALLFAASDGPRRLLASLLA